MEVKEVMWRPVSVDLEWGKLSGKISVIGKEHSKSNLRILGVHGWLDNANTFDTLAPYLPSDTELMVLDLPGHGLSDHLPQGARYDILSYILHLKKAIDKYGWDSFVLIGHSMGACISTIFTSVFPEHVLALVNLDYVKTREASLPSLQNSISTLLKGEEMRKQKPLVYTEEQAIERLIKARGNLGEYAAIDRDAAYILLPRSACQVEGGYVWSHDPRARANFQAIYSALWNRCVSSIKCPVLLVTANQGMFTPAVLEVCEDTLNAFCSNTKWLDVASVDGSHHVHLTHPERVAVPLVAFLNRVVKETAVTPLRAML